MAFWYDTDNLNLFLYSCIIIPNFDVFYKEAQFYNGFLMWHKFNTIIFISMQVYRIDCYAKLLIIKKMEKNDQIITKT